jgi:hypothetical protein
LKKSTLKLVLLASAVYYATFLFARSFFPGDFTPPLYFLVGPLILFVLILISDLSYRATVPMEVRVKNPPSRKLAREIQQLSRQIEVGSRASPGYFENVLLVRVREVLVERVSLETGMEPGRVRELLENPGLGTGLLRNDSLYRLLYSPPPARGPARVKMLEDAVALVEAWKL